MRRIRAHGFLNQWRLYHRTVHALPALGNARHLFVLGQPGVPQHLEEARSLALQKAFVDGTCAAEALLGQRLPPGPGTQRMDDGLKRRRARFGGRPALGLRRYLCSCAKRSGINGSTRSRKSSVTTHGGSA